MPKPRRRWTRLAGEPGFALPFALTSMLTIGTLSVGMISYSISNYGSAKRSDADRQALALAEAGLNYAYSTLYNSGTPTMASAVPSRTVSLETGDATYYGVLSGDTWRLVGIGTVRSPTGATAPVVRTVSGKASLGSAQHGTANNAVWNYIYVDDPTATTSLGNSVNVNIPLYVRGNLRLTNSAQVSSYALQVGGTLELLNSSHVGESGTPIHEAHVGGGCRLGSSGAFTQPCGPAQQVYATISDADWDPQANLLAFVSGGNVNVGNSTVFQGAIYAVNDYAEDNNSTVWGPIIARRIALANSSVNHYVPIGTLMPGMPATNEEVVTITNEPGSWG